MIYISEASFSWQQHHSRLLRHCTALASTSKAQMPFPLKCVRCDHSAVSLRACYPEFIWLKWQVLCVEPAPLVVLFPCTKPAEQQQTEQTVAVWNWLVRSVGTSVSSRGFTVPAPKEDFSPGCLQRRYFHRLCSMGSLVQRRCEPSVWSRWLSWSGCDSRSLCLRCCSARDPPPEMCRHEGAVTLR